MAGNYNVWKVDQDLNILINYNYNPTGVYPNHRGISNNPSNLFICSSKELKRDSNIQFGS